jgi:hypothetical protein
MQLKLTRITRTDKSTIGKLFVDGAFLCYILEDKDRGLKQSDPLLVTKAKKMFGVTAIPAGTYEVILSYSNRFKKYLPQLVNVPAYEGVRIHPGNIPEHTEGCLLPGNTTAKDFVGDSRTAFEALMHVLEPALKREKVFITIE